MRLHVARSSRKSTRAAALLSGVAAEDVYPASRSISYPTLLAHSQCAMSPFSPTRSKREREQETEKNQGQERKSQASKSKFPGDISFDPKPRDRQVERRRSFSNSKRRHVPPTLLSFPPFPDEITLLLASSSQSFRQGRVEMIPVSLLLRIDFDMENKTDEEFAE